MNIFVTSECPVESAIVLPDKHIVKMGLETCQMLAVVASSWYHNYGPLYKKNGEPYKTNAHRNHPCTKWAAESIHNSAWLISHGLAIMAEYRKRYNKTHGCQNTLLAASSIFPSGDLFKHTPFVRAMPDDLKNDSTIDTFTAYKKYLNTKSWVKNNYLRIPESKPYWIE